jgi:hypothetical protein
MGQMRLFRTAQEDMLGDSVREVLMEDLSRPASPTDYPVKRSVEESSYIAPGIVRFKSYLPCGWSVSSLVSAAKACHADAVKFSASFVDLGFVSECTNSPDYAEVYNGRGVVYVKCIVAVGYHGHPDEVYAAARSLGVKI